MKVVCVSEKHREVEVSQCLSEICQVFPLRTSKKDFTHFYQMLASDSSVTFTNICLQKRPSFQNNFERSSKGSSSLPCYITESRLHPKRPVTVYLRTSFNRSLISYWNRVGIPVDIILFLIKIIICVSTNWGVDLPKQGISERPVITFTSYYHFRDIKMTTIIFGEYPRQWKTQFPKPRALY